MHWPEAWLPSSDMDKGDIHPDTSITLLETWWVGLKLDWACVGLGFCLLGKLFLVRQRECICLLMHLPDAWLPAAIPNRKFTQTSASRCWRHGGLGVGHKSCSAVCPAKRLRGIATVVATVFGGQHVGWIQCALRLLCFEALVEEGLTSLQECRPSHIPDCVCVLL